jgi:NADH-quinone oxidoreductase subunit A
MPQYVPVLILMALAATFAVLATGMTFVLGPKKPTPEKLAPYECGIEEISPPTRRFPVQYLVTGMLFIIFDIEAASLIPLAVLMRRLGVLGLVELLVFVAMLAIPLLYVWRKGALSWE